MKVLVLACVLLGACADGGIPASQATVAARAADTRPIPDIWRGRCGNCHERVQPGEHTRDFLTDALKRHRKRVRLTEEQWQAMIDFLALH